MLIFFVFAADSLFDEQLHCFRSSEAIMRLLFSNKSFLLQMSVFSDGPPRRSCSATAAPPVCSGRWRSRHGAAGNKSSKGSSGPVWLRFSLRPGSSVSVGNTTIPESQEDARQFRLKPHDVKVFFLKRQTMILEKKKTQEVEMLFLTLEE